MRKVDPADVHLHHFERENNRRLERYEAQRKARRFVFTVVIVLVLAVGTLGAFLIFGNTGGN